MLGFQLSAIGYRIWYNAPSKGETRGATHIMVEATPNLADLAAENAALRRELERYRSVVHQLTTGVYLYELEDRNDDRSLRMLDANPAVELLTGIPTTEQIGKTLDENFPGLREQGIPQAYARVVTTGTSIESEAVYGDERVITSAFAIRAVPLPGNEVAVFFDNITLRKQTELALKQLNAELEQRVAERTAELQHSQNLLCHVLDYAPAAIYIKDLEGRFLLINQRAADLLGLKTKDFVGKFDHELFPAEHVAKWHQAEAEVVRTRQPVVQEDTIPQADGMHTFLSSRAPIFNEHDQVYAIGGVSTDITERIRDEKRAADERADMQAQIIEAQQHALRELSTPLLPLSNNVVLMPIIGTIDSRRASQVMETLLQGVAEHNADIAIVDITGVQVVDTQVANAFIQAARAVQLLGAQVVITGIRPEVAQTLVQLGVDLEGMLSRGSLQAGVAYALKMARGTA